MAFTISYLDGCLGLHEDGKQMPYLTFLGLRHPDPIPHVNSMYVCLFSAPMFPIPVGKRFTAGGQTDSFSVGIVPCSTPVDDVHTIQSRIAPGVS